uniref:restriction endonuclease subunit S n=1 Tax=uncultured Phascolarctobacterium sp. TaxID=512296 RepID=UPI0027D9B35C
PLPPIPEQHRIVARIESLFEKLDHARELVQSALDSFESRKAAILHKAFTGELTAKWRNENGVGLESWKIIPLSQLAHIQTGLAKGKKNTKRTIQMPYLRVANVQDGYLDLAEIKTISVEENKVDRYILQQEDVLFTEGGDFDKLGRGAVWQSEIEPCLHQNHVFAVRPDQSTLNAFYLAYLAGSQYGKNYFLSCSKQTTNLASINSTQLKAFPVLCPQIKEQQEIICVLTRLIKKEQQAKDQLEPILDQIDMMKKSILARAFRGELGTNDPSEESAMELLKNL